MSRKHWGKCLWRRSRFPGEIAIPLRIVFRHMGRSDAVKAAIHKRIENLDCVASRSVERPHSEQFSDTSFYLVAGPLTCASEHTWKQQVVCALRSI